MDRRDNSRAKRTASWLIGAGLFSLAIAFPAGAASFKSLYSFCPGRSPCTDGRTPEGGLLIDSHGDLFGTTPGGGAYNSGAVFELTLTPKKTYTETPIYSFCSGGGNCTDGEAPQSNLIMDSSGNLYGTTAGGGLNNRGTVFELSPAGGGAYTENVLYSFCSTGGESCTDGRGPFGGVVMDSDGDLYGTTNTGGTPIGADTGPGVVFELIPNESKTSYTEQVIYNFCAQSGCSDGITPYAGLLMDSYGDLFGTTAGGGNSNSGGVAYELTPNESKTAYTESVLYNFCSQGGDACTDGDDPSPFAPLTADSGGNLYGVTLDGGAHAGGVVFKLTYDATTTSYSPSTLYNFCAKGGSKCTDGSHPQAGLVVDTSGNLYGSTYSGGGGKDKQGTVFELAFKKKKDTYAQSILHSFCSTYKKGICEDGGNPVGTMAVDSLGKLYGTTNRDGPYGEGTVFRVIK
ncbi:MAG TPA: choice-of-anchor tandem repeat GloVer-containing protein [Candidatus Binataceae bacterium]|nr:choice-of-anchor tandem repeat GloVer-containing protein [Candidatus Binataceae bacterium]